MRTLIIALVLGSLLGGCTEESPKNAAPDDGCVGYLIKPDGSKTCVGK